MCYYTASVLYITNYSYLIRKSCFLNLRLGFQARKQIWNIGSFEISCLVEGIENFSVLSHNEVATHDPQIVAFINQLGKRQTFHLLLTVVAHWFRLEDAQVPT